MNPVVAKPKSKAMKAHEQLRVVREKSVIQRPCRTSQVRNGRVVVSKKYVGRVPNWFVLTKGRLQ